ncbi:MAG: hypothetical protein ACFFDF_20950 [Candidatus Odinarchaeota archaeon]
MNLLDLDGYIALHRELLGKPIWQKSTPEHKTVLIILLLMANHKEMEWEWQGNKFKVFPGQFITSLDGIKKACGKGITTQNIRSALKRFEKYEFLTDSTTKTGRLITILKWHTYQVDKIKTNKDSNKEVTKKQQRGNKEVTPNKNDKNDKNNKYTDEFENWYSKYPRSESKGRTFINYQKALKEYSHEQLMTALKNYKVKVINTDKQFIKSSANFLGRDKYFEDYFEIEQEKPITVEQDIIRAPQSFIDRIKGIG